MGQISYGPSVGPAHLNFVGHFWAGPRVNISYAHLDHWMSDTCANVELTRDPSANENFTRGKSALVVAISGLSDPKPDPIA